MKVSKAGLQHIVTAEGLRTEMYRDPVGLPTIGVGHLLTQEELSTGKIDVGYGEVVKWRNGLTREQVETLLAKDIEWAEEAVNSTFRKAHKKYGKSVELKQHQFDMLVSLVFNIGVGAWERSTLVRRILANRLDDIPDQMLRWKYSAGEPILLKRRQAEVKIYQEGYV